MSKSAPESDLVSIVPLGGLRVRKPSGQLLDPKGEAVAWNAYWRRRQLEGDIERVPTDAKGRARSKAAALPSTPTVTE